MIDYPEDSFCVYQKGQYDSLWDEFLDYLGMQPPGEDRGDLDNLEFFIGLRRDEISDHAAETMRSYVRGHGEE